MKHAVVLVLSAAAFTALVVGTLLGLKRRGPNTWGDLEQGPKPKAVDFTAAVLLVAGGLLGFVATAVSELWQTA